MDGARMKLKLEPGQISCRLSRDEAQELINTQEVKDSMSFPDGAVFNVHMAMIDTLAEPHFSYHPESHTFAFALNAKDAMILATTPMKNGFEGDFAGGKYSIAVDLKDFPKTPPVERTEK